MQNLIADDRLSHVVHLVDAHIARDGTARFLAAAGYTVRTYESSTHFLTKVPKAGCVVLELQLPDMNGLEVQQRLLQTGESLPVVFWSGHADIPDSVRAIRAGAVDFLRKSSDASPLLEAVSRALAVGDEQRSKRDQVRELRARYSTLSRRERDVFAHLISGQLNKQIGFDLGISVQTTKIHRHRVLQKMKAESIADLVRMAAAIDVLPVGSVR